MENNGNHWWEDIGNDFDLYREQHPNDDRSIQEVAEDGDWQRWYDNDQKPLLD